MHPRFYTRLYSRITQEALRQAFKNWDSLQQLGTHPLVDLALVRSQLKRAGYANTNAGRGLALRTVLQEAVDALKPEDDMPDPQERSWRPYVILSEQYLHGRSPDWIKAQMHISKTTYHSEQRRALDLLANILQKWEEEQRAQESAVVYEADPVRLASPIPFLAPPKPAHALVGRAELLVRVKEQLTDSQESALAALKGLPGVGKTTLAIALAHDPVIQRHFPDGVLWVGLGRRPDLLFWLGIWAAAVGISEEAVARYADIPQRAAAVHAAIGLRRILLVIDDAWQTEAALAFKVGGPNCAHLLTTRLTNVALDFAGAEALLVQELSRSQGLELLAEIAPRAVEAAPQEAQEITRLVGGLPLAIILMGNYLRKESYSEQPRRLYDALSRLHTAEARFQLTQPQSPLEASPTFQPGASLSLQAAINLSRTSLDPAAERALFNLSLFMPKPNTFSEAAALTVTGSTVDVLDSLVDHGLLESVAPERYTLHQTIADFAALRGAEAEALARYVRYFVRYTEERQTEHDTLAQELTNILSALDAARSASLHTWLVRGIHALHSFLETRGLYQLDEQYLDRARHAAEAEGDRAALAHILLHMGELGVRSGRFRQAQESLRMSVRLAERIKDRRIEGAGLMNLGLACWYRNGGIEDRDYFQRARQCFQEVGDLENEGYVLNGLAYASVEQGKFEAAKTHLAQALRVCRESGNRRGEGLAHYHLGMVHLPLGDFDRASSHWEQCQEIYLELGDRRGEGWIAYSWGRYHRQKGDYEQARQSFEQARDIFEEIGEQLGLGYSSHNLGLVCNDRGEYAQAATYFNEALALFQMLEAQVGENVALTSLGIRLRQLGDYQGAKDYLERALSAWRELDYPRSICKAQANLGLVHLYQGQLSDAQSCCQQALQLANEIGARPTQAYVLSFFGHVLLGTEQLSEAEEVYREAAAIRLALGQPHQALDPQAGLAQTLLARGEVGGAQGVVETMLSHAGDFDALTHSEQALGGTDAPCQILLTCYEVLHACHDARERAALHAADLMLHRRVDGLDGHAQRRHFLENVPAHQHILHLTGK
jgi:tetratricopeptide (TPR) repeat protein